MSPTVARTAFRAVQRRQFSMLTTMRHMARSFEPHPFQRMSPLGSAKPDYFKMIKFRLGTAGLFFPLIFSVLGWPYAAYALLDGRL
ncbi:hypothetical protein F5X68DRAFT_196261 [Plectosphaerella plurivora]|uniref:Cytochrome c oxidase subunit VIIc n=1 Tax=Plectosphaerella plurivora TaxID=936078 RepID=A0A9P9AHZ8_9PEZI|nr:hypothetical protein F5X68DRAFT_196261 [Plectosphaerella plurivora]